MTLDGLMFDHFLLYSFVDGIVRSKASVYPRIFDVVVMSVVVKGGVFEFIGHGFTKNWVVLCDSYQDWF